jgi:diguanylate cyclase (GGDEF)-like protein
MQRVGGEVPAGLHYRRSRAEENVVRILRRASLVVSLVLVIAIAVSFVARRSEAAHTRDTGLQTAARVGASHMSSIVDVVEIAARTGDDAATVAAAIERMQPLLGVCVVSASTTVCSGNGPQPPRELVAEHEAARVSDGVLHDEVAVTSYDSLIVVDVDGPAVSIVAVAPAEAVGTQGAVRVWATTFLPPGMSADEFQVDGGARQTAIAVAGLRDVYVVAVTEDAIQLPADEVRIYLLIFALALVLLMTAGATIAIEHRNLVERASFDPLTRLPNRSEFERRTADIISGAERSGSPFCLLLFDLDGFKQVNDTHGHAAGDEMLKVVGSRLRKAVRDGDVVARWGGDEFVVVMPGVGDDKMAARRAEQLAEQIAGRTRLEGIAEALRVRVSVGVAMWPAHGADLDAIVEAADRAMYQAKREGVD